jgi:DNA replication and repair protein RecF
VILRPVLRSLRLLDFRCFESLVLEVPETGVLLVGDNAQGKTSLLEAVCVLVRLHSPRAHRLGTVVRKGAAGFGVAGETWGTERQVRHAAGITTCLADGQPRSSAGDYLADGGLVVWMGNDDLELVRGPGTARRRYLDFIGSQLWPEYRRAHLRYRRALQARNLLLRDPRAGALEIDVYDALLAAHGETLRRLRAELVTGLTPMAAAAHRRIGGGGENFDLHYHQSGADDFAAALAEARQRDRRNGRTSVGPHRDDLRLEVDGLRAADFASEGQQRTLALALKLAQGAMLEQRRGMLPVYLIDDIFGELDPGRRNALMAHLPEHAQCWITTTHLGWLDAASPARRLQQLRVHGGSIEA